MPLYQLHLAHNKACVNLWHITETPEILYQQLFKTVLTQDKQKKTSLFEPQDYEKISLPKQQQEWLSSRLLIQNFCQDLQLHSPTLCIKKDEFGKPFLKDQTQYYHISISHAFPYSVVAFHPHENIGIDVEQISPKIEKVAKRVFTPAELAWATNLDELTLLWCAKEALYKWYGKKALDFRQHLHITKNIPTQTYTGMIINPQTNIEIHLALQYFQIEDYKIVICC
jgi:4'-phosphopantetheinyl transferase